MHKKVIPDIRVRGTFDAKWEESIVAINVVVFAYFYH